MNVRQTFRNSQSSKELRLSTNAKRLAENESKGCMNSLESVNRRITKMQNDLNHGTLSTGGCSIFSLISVSTLSCSIFLVISSISCRSRTISSLSDSLG